MASVPLGLHSAARRSRLVGIPCASNAWGTLTGVWVPHDARDQTVDFVRRWSEKTEIGAGRFIEWLDITASKFYDWRERYGKANEHNGWVPARFLAGGM